MLYQTNTNRSKRKTRKNVDIVQNEFSKAYISTIDNSRRPQNSLSTMLNMELVQDNIVRPRPPLVRYGTQVPEVRASTPTSVYTNFIVNPNIETNTTGWTGFNATLTRSTVEFYSGVASLSVQVTTINGVGYAALTGLTASTNYYIKCRVKATVGKIIFVQTTSGTVGYNYAQITATGGWDSLTLNITSAGTTGNLEFGMTTTGTFYLDNVILSDLDTTYFDGATLDTADVEYTWTGTVNASKSTQSTYALIPMDVVGRGKYRWNGERGLLWMLDDAGVGKIYKQVDGGAFELLGGSYDITNWTMFCQSKGKVFPFNGTDNLSYLDLESETVSTFTALATPSAPSDTGSANLISGTKPHDYYYRVSANNAVGESIASAASAAVNVNTLREGWSSEAAIAKTVALTWSSVVGATSYTIYVGTTALTTNELITVTGTAFTDDGSLSINPYKLAPQGNSTQGFTPRWIYNDSKNSQIFGVSDDNKLYYSAPGTSDFSPYNGGGWVSIDEDGDTDLNFVDGFRDGKGDPVITTSSRGAAGKGLLSHVTFDSITVGDQVIIYPNVYPASGQSGTYAPRATIKTRDSLTYFTGQDVKSTGTSQNVMNILTTNSIAQVIEPDLDKINLEALSGAVGVEHKDRGYFALPVSSSSNNEIWYIDFSRKNAWILRWTVAAKDLWLYEDTLGNTHFCALVDNIILEFSRRGSQTHQDDGEPWRSEIGYSALVWDKAGITLGKIRNQYYKLLQPQGNITATATGITRRGIQTAAGQDNFESTTSYTGIGQWDYSGNYMYGDDPGQVNSFGKSVAVLQVKPKGLLNQLSWVIGADTAGSDYMLSSVSTRGWSSDELIMKTRN